MFRVIAYSPKLLLWKHDLSSNFLATVVAGARAAACLVLSCKLLAYIPHTNTVPVPGLMTTAKTSNNEMKMENGK